MNNDTVGLALQNKIIIKSIALRWQKMAAAAVAGVTGVIQPQYDPIIKSSPCINQKSKKLTSRSLKTNKSIGAVSPAFRPRKTWLEKGTSLYLIIYMYIC